MVCVVSRMMSSMRGRARRLLEDVLETRLGVRVAGREQGDVVSRLHEPVGEQRDHPFDPAVALGGTAIHGGRSRDPQAAGFLLSVLDHACRCYRRAADRPSR